MYKCIYIIMSLFAFCSAENFSGKHIISEVYLSPRDEEFALQLSDKKRPIFLNEFSAWQRQQAIRIYEMSQIKNCRKNCGIPKKLTPDDAIEWVLKTCKKTTFSYSSQ